MVPTLLGLAGVTTHREMQGRNCAGLLTGGTESPGSAPESAYLQSYTATEGNEFPAWRGVRTTRYIWWNSE
jgi:hypothetical protein